MISVIHGLVTPDTIWISLVPNHRHATGRNRPPRDENPAQQGISSRTGRGLSLSGILVSAAGYSTPIVNTWSRELVGRVTYATCLP